MKENPTTTRLKASKFSIRDTTFKEKLNLEIFQQVLI